MDAATFKGAVTEVLRNEYQFVLAAASKAAANRTKEAEVAATLAAHRVPAGASSYNRLPAGAKMALTHLHVQQTAAEDKESLVALLQMGFGLMPSCAALGDCAATKHKLELALLRLTEPSPSKPVLSPPAKFRSLVSETIRTGVYVPAAVAAAAIATEKNRVRAVVATLAAHNVPAGAHSFDRLSKTTQAALRKLHCQQTAAEDKESLVALLQMGFDLVSGCAALGDCAASKHKLELAVNRLWDLKPVLSPPAKFRSLVSETIRTGVYVPASVATAFANGELRRRRAVVATLAAHNVPAGAHSFDRLPKTTKAALRKLHFQQTAAEDKESLAALLQMGFGLMPSCAALGDCASSKHKLELAVNRLTAPSRPVLSPPATFRSLVSDTIRAGVYRPPSPPREKRESLEIEELQEALASSGLLSPPGSAPPSPARPACEAGPSCPDLQLSKGTRISGSLGLESQLRIMKQLFDDGLVPPKVYLGVGGEILDSAGHPAVAM